MILKNFNNQDQLNQLYYGQFIIYSNGWDDYRYNQPYDMKKKKKLSLHNFLSIFRIIAYAIKNKIKYCYATFKF